MYAKKVKKKGTTRTRTTQKKHGWRKKCMENIQRDSQDRDVDEGESNRWLKSAGLTSETKGLIVAAQDQALKTKYMQAKIIKNGTDPNCRICGRF